MSPTRYEEIGDVANKSARKLTTSRGSYEELVPVEFGLYPATYIHQPSSFRNTKVVLQVTKLANKCREARKFSTGIFAQPLFGQLSKHDKLHCHKYTPQWT